MFRRSGSISEERMEEQRRHFQGRETENCLRKQSNRRIAQRPPGRPVPSCPENRTDPLGSEFFLPYRTAIRWAISPIAPIDIQARGAEDMRPAYRFSWWNR